MREIALVSGEFYTAGTNFTRPPVVTVATNFKSVLDFGEANVYQKDLDCFLAIAEEIKLKGLTEQISIDLLEEQKIQNTPNQQIWTKNRTQHQPLLAKVNQQHLKLMFQENL